MCPQHRALSHPTHKRLLPPHSLSTTHHTFPLSTGLLVDDAREAYTVATANGGVGVLAPLELKDEASGSSQVISEVKLYGDVVMRFVSGSFQVGGWWWWRGRGRETGEAMVQPSGCHRCSYQYTRGSCLPRSPGRPQCAEGTARHQKELPLSFPSGPLPGGLQLHAG